MRALLALMLVVLYAFNGEAQGSLEPSEDVLTAAGYELDYLLSIRNVLFNGLNETSRARFVQLPAFDAESVLDINHGKDSKIYAIFHVAEKSIWYSKKRHKVKIKKYRREINKESANLIENLYIRAVGLLERTKYPEHALDSDSHYFISYDNGPISGKNGYYGELFKISEDIIALVKSGTGIIEFDSVMKKRIDTTMESIMPGYTEPKPGFIIADRFAITDYMQNRNNIRENKNPEYKEVWFLPGIDYLTYVFKNDVKIASYLFSGSEIPTAFIKEITKNIDIKLVGNGFDSMTLGNILHNSATTNFYGISNKGFSLGDSPDKGLRMYGIPDKISNENGVERCEWIFKGALAGALPVAGQKPVAQNSYGHRVVMFFDKNKLVAMILYNDLP